MQLSTASDVQIYNLSAGRSLPKWLSSEAKRKLEKKNIDVRRRIELIQDFEMPDISHTVDVTPDGRYIFATGAYRPSLKCYDLNDLSIKFERGLDADVVKLLVLSDDFSKVVLLQQDRYLEMHAAFGRYFRMRMPRFGRDMAFSKECSDLYLVGASSDIYRLNLEQGGWLSPLQSHSPGINCCSFANDHQLFVCGSSLPDSAVFLVPGTNDGKVEAWDHRDKTRVGVLDCVIPLLEEHTSAEVTSLQFRDGLHLGVGMSTGHVLLYDLRSRRPLVVKDHNYGQPIKKIDYVAREEGNIVLSMDSRVLKMWHEENGKPFAAIESETPLTDFARYPNSGLLFFSNETSRMQQHFVPALGPAPKWCSFLETLTEELEETEAPTVYDDYKFVTRQQLEGLGLSQLIGTSVLRAYMHGYFIDARLYNKAQTLTQPFAYDKYKDRKVKDILDAERETSLVVKKTNLPKVNKNIALRLQKSADAVSTKTKDKKKAMTASSILEDSRFKKLFENEDFQVDEESDPFKHISTQADRDRRKTGAVEVEEDSGNDEEDEPIETTLPGDEEVRDDTMHQSDIESENTDNEEEEEKKEKQKERERRKQLTREKRAQKYVQRKEAEENEKIERLASKPKKFVLHDLANGETSKKFIEKEKIETAQKELPMSIKKRKIRKPGQLEHVEETDFGGRSMTFVLEKRGKAAREERDKTKREEHQKERKELVRRTTDHVAKNMKRLPSNLNLKRTQKH